MPTPPLRGQSSFRRAIAIADTEEFAAIAQALTAKTGCPKSVPYRTAIIALLLHGIRGTGPMWLTAVLQAARHVNTTEVLADRGYTQLAATSFPLANPDRPTIRDRLAGSDPPTAKAAARS